MSGRPAQASGQHLADQHVCQARGAGATLRAATGHGDVGHAGQTRVLGVSERALAALGQYHWPGNVRELRNTVYESLVKKLSGSELLLSDLPRRILERPRDARHEQALFEPARLAARFDGRSMNLRLELENLERAALEEALRRAAGNPGRAAQLLGEVVGRGAARDPAGPSVP